MTNPETGAGPLAPPASLSPALGLELARVAQTCTACGNCRRQCLFLERQGLPGAIAQALDPAQPAQLTMAFGCSLCGLCAAVCPEGLDPARLFLEMRRQAVAQGVGDLPAHRGLLAYQDRGLSRRYTWHALPPGCRTVFFPGCNLPGSRPRQTWALFERLRQADPALGLVLDCCAKPSHDLGRQAEFLAAFGELRDWLAAQGVERVLTACPNCQRVFAQYGQPLTARTVYQELAQALPPGAPPEPLPGVWTLHDPCALRQDSASQQAVRALAARAGLALEEMPHHGRLTFCCGEGGGVAAQEPSLAQAWSQRRTQEAQGRRVLTYCGGCAARLGRSLPTSHLLDLLEGPQAASQALAGQVPVSKAPFTYLNRLRFKRRAQREIKAAVSRARQAAPRRAGGGRGRALALLLVLAAALLAAHLSGAGQYLEPQRLRLLLESHPVAGPLIYVAAYVLATVLILPAVPLTLLAGVLFGPFWGVVYAISGATGGACLAFLAARHGARWGLEKHLAGSRLKRLDDDVRRHGWKVVAFTRLIPLFPFNILNYALGLTSIRFSHYALVSFICMLPACVGLVVFSASLTDLLMGRASPLALGLGAGLLALVFLAPWLYRRRGRGGPAEPY